MAECEGKHAYVNFSARKSINPFLNIAGKRMTNGWIWSKCVADKSNG